MGFLSPPALISILIALSVHEWAHAVVANMLGDPTAEHEGRLTLNPISHLDPMGTILFLFVGFGWGKPVPVNPTYFKKPKRDMALVAFAGPLSNFVLAWIAFIGLFLIGTAHVGSDALSILAPAGHNGLWTVIEQVLRTSLFINLALMAFNLLPIAPLDGSKILHMFIPPRHEELYQQFMARGMLFLLLLLIMERVLNIPILFGWIYGIMGPILQLMDLVAGVV